MENGDDVAVAGKHQTDLFHRHGEGVVLHKELEGGREGGREVSHVGGESEGPHTYPHILVRREIVEATVLGGGGCRGPL